MSLSGWLGRILWTMLAVSMLYYVFLFGSSYASCRADGSDNLVCFFVALIVSAFEAGAFLIVSAIKFLTLILP